MQKIIRVAVISDIHANLIALESVLKDIKKKEISQIYCLGDLVDFAPWGNEVISRIKMTGIPCLMGNHDERIAFDRPINPLPHHEVNETQNRLIAIEHTKNTITARNKDWLAELPYQLKLSYKIENRLSRILLVHGSYWSNEDYVFEKDSKVGFADILRTKDIDCVVMGHTHKSYIQYCEGVLFVNCGSVGRTKEKDGMATYSVLNISNEEIKAEICKVKYPIDEVADAIYKSKIPDFYGDFLLLKD